MGLKRHSVGGQIHAAVARVAILAGRASTKPKDTLPLPSSRCPRRLRIPVTLSNWRTTRGPDPDGSTQPPGAGYRRANTSALAGVAALFARSNCANCTLAVLLGLFVLAALFDTRIAVDSLLVCMSEGEKKGGGKQGGIAESVQARNSEIQTSVGLENSARTSACKRNTSRLRRTFL